jgi:hypothetical protein
MAKAGRGKPMRYLEVRWHHTSPDEPIILFSETDENGWELRKVYVFRTGPPGYASERESTRSVMLGLEPLPSIEEIASDLQFEPRGISKEEFEEVWRQARSHARS